MVFLKLSGIGLSRKSLFRRFMLVSYDNSDYKNFPGINTLLKISPKKILAFSKKVINLGADSYLCEQITATELLSDSCFFSCS